MKKVFTLILIGLLAICASACNSETSANTESTDSISDTSVTTVETTEENIVINIPYSCFDSVSDDDCIVTGTDMKNGIISKELSDNGGIILTVEKDKYEDLLAYEKAEFEEEIENFENNNTIVGKVEYSDNLDTINIYFQHSYFVVETEPETESTYEGAYASNYYGETAIAFTGFGNIFKDSIYYQSLIEQTDTELLTCKYYFIDSSNDNIMEESIYPEE